MNNIEKLLAESIASLELLAEVLQSVPADKYAAYDSELFQASIGQHVRHVLDHYQMLAAGLESGIIDYDGRPRNGDIENDVALALSHTKKLIDEYRHILPVDTEVDVRLDTRLASSHNNTAIGKQVHAQHSTLARELSFVHLHAVHHYALIAVMIRFLKLDIELSNFGIAPSTVKYRENSRCAP